MDIETSLTLIDKLSNSSQANLYMGFLLGDRNYVISAEQILEVMKLPALVSLEKVPPHIIGLVNLRGQLLTVIDIRNFLGLPSKQYRTDNCLIIINIGHQTWGLIVDQIIDVLDLNDKQFETIPYTSNVSESKIIKGIVKDETDIYAFLNLDYIRTHLLQFQAEDYTILPEGGIDQQSLFCEEGPSRKIFKERAKNLQQEIKELIHLTEDVNTVRFVTFLLNNETYALPIQSVKEFCSLNNFATIPCVPDFILGLINLRGEFYALIDIKTFLWVKSEGFNEKSKVIIINSKDLNIGLVVDDVFDIISLPLPTIHSSGSSSKIESNKYVSGEVVNNNGQVITILDVDKLIKDERLIIEDAV